MMKPSGRLVWNKGCDERRRRKIEKQKLSHRCRLGNFTKIHLKMVRTDWNSLLVSVRPSYPGTHPHNQSVYLDFVEGRAMRLPYEFFGWTESAARKTDIIYHVEQLLGDRQKFIAFFVS